MKVRVFSRNEGLEFENASFSIDSIGILSIYESYEKSEDGKPYIGQKIACFKEWQEVSSINQK